MLECVVNVSEGRRADIVAALAMAAGPCLLDVHCDPDHHRSVFTMAGPGKMLQAGVRALAAETVARLDLTDHTGAHPRLGVLDVVPWISLSGWPLADGPPVPAVAARDRFAQWCGQDLGVPCFLYGAERSLPAVRRAAWVSARPDTGPSAPHPTAGATAVGARPLLVAYNVWLAEPDLERARAVAAQLRGPAVRALGLGVGPAVQVSFNLIDPIRTGPTEVFDAVARLAEPARAELVGLVPAAVLDAVPSRRWAELDLDPSRTIEARLERVGLDSTPS